MSDQPYDPYIPNNNAPAAGAQGPPGNQRTAHIQQVSCHSYSVVREMSFRRSARSDDASLPAVVVRFAHAARPAATSSPSPSLFLPRNHRELDAEKLGNAMQGERLANMRSTTETRRFWMWDGSLTAR